jgi:CSLREA domain-containing protein
MFKHAGELAPGGQSRRTVVAVIAFVSLLVAQLSVSPAFAAVEAATMTVTTVNDTVSNGDGCSLREAINAANLNATVNECTHNGSSGTDRIEFEIPGAGPHTIVLASQLPTIASAVAIDGYTDTGAAVNTQASTTNAVLKITLSGAGGPAGQNGLYFLNASACESASPHCMVRGLNLQQFKGDALKLENTDNVDIFGNFIGTNVLGTTDANAVGGNGIHIINGDANDIGDPVVGVATRNIISGLEANGVLIEGDSSFGNAIAGNLIGTDATGTVDLGNTKDGILVVTAEGTNIGGGVSTTPGGSCTGSCNVISGNQNDGIEMRGDINVASTIQGNIIGLDVTGEVLMANTGDGISLDRVANLTIGGSTAAVRNIISGNIGDGIRIDDFFAGVQAPDNNVIAGNFIGTDGDGNQGKGNHANGIEIRGGSGSRVGGTTGTTPDGACTGECNVIASNFDAGVYLTDSATNSLVQGNHIGVDRDGTADMGNALQGVAINGPGPGHTVGGASPAARNVISGNTGDGVFISGPTTTGNVVQGNYIGTDTHGVVDLGNSAGGVHVSNSAGNSIGGTAGTTPGGLCSGACNLISGNQTFGVRIDNANSTANSVLGNIIGLDVTGTLDLGNTSNGVYINGSSSNTIGGTTAAGRNVISGNNGDGVRIDGALSTGNVVQGNYIGVNDGGTVDLGNLGVGVNILNSPTNTIGGTSGVTTGGACTGACNVISGNNQGGVNISGSAITPANGNNVLGNFIGTDVTGTADVGNTGNGVLISGAKDNFVGGTKLAKRNVISGNSINGVRITNAGATGNRVQGNIIGLQTNGTTTLGNTSDGVGVDTSATGNRIGGATNTTPGGSCTGTCNVISGNGGDGIQLTSANNDVLGNFIGVNIAGTLGRANGGAGVIVSSADNNKIGGTTDSGRNVISANAGSGVVIRDGADSTLVRKNYIGTNSAGTANLGNGGGGVVLTAVVGTVVGGPGLANRIAFNTDDGVAISNGGTAASNNSVRANRIYSNGGLGIDLANDGHTGNDNAPPPDSDPGPNGLQNHPVATSAVSSTKVISGTLTSTPSTTFTLDFYKNGSCDGSGFGEGGTYLGSTTVSTDGSGVVAFAFAVPTSFIAGNRITATATDPNGNTSEFSGCVTAT